MAALLVLLGFALGPAGAVPAAAASTAAISDSRVTHFGEGTYYDMTDQGNCSFPALSEDRMVAAINHIDYGNADYCGAYIQATGPNGTVVVQIIDICLHCAAGDVDFSEQAFAKIADLAAGRERISWQLISPDTISGPILYHFHDGSNQWWTSVQIRNHRNPIAGFEYRAVDGSFKKATPYQVLPRSGDNYFVATAGLGPGPYTFRVTDVYGNTITDTGVALTPGGDEVRQRMSPLVLLTGRDTVKRVTGGCSCGGVPASPPPTERG
jgi:expansin